MKEKYILSTYMNKKDTEKAMDLIMLTKDLKTQSYEIIRLKAELEKEIRQAFVHGQGNRALMEVGLERDETEDYVSSRMRSLLKGNSRDMSKVAIKIVEYFNPDETVWDSKMYEQKRVVIMLLQEQKQINSCKNSYYED